MYSGPYILIRITISNLLFMATRSDDSQKPDDKHKASKTIVIQTKEASAYN